MNIDVSGAIIGALAIAVCFVPVIMINRGRKKREKNQLEILLNIAAKHSCELQQYELFGNFGIGFDAQKNCVFYFKMIEHQVLEHFVDLSNIQTCTINKATRTFSNQNNSHVVIDKLELIFSTPSKDVQAVKMEFFNAEESLQLSTELMSIEKWAKLFNNQLKHKKG